MRRLLGGIVAAGLAVSAALALGASPSTAQGGELLVGVGVEDASWHVGASAGQYAGSPEDDGPEEFVSHEAENFDPTGHSTRRFPSYGIQSRLSVRALVIDGPAAGDGDRVAIVKNDLYIPQDLVARRAGQILEQECPECGIRFGNASTPGNLTVAVTHNHSSPFYSSTSWGVWAFQDVFDIRFFEYMARKMATAVQEAVRGPSQAGDEQSRGLTPAMIAARSVHFDKTHRHSFGPARADDGTPAGYPNDDQDHDLTVIRLDAADGEPLANLVNFSLHPEFLEGNDLISADYVGPLERMLDRETGAVTVYTQGAVGTSEPERSSFHSIHERLEFTHRDYAQAEWGARLMADAAEDAWRKIGDDSPSGDDRYLSYSDFGESPDVQMADRWYPGPFSHPYPGVSNCRVDSTPGIPIVGLPDCQETGFGVEDALDQIPVPEPVEDQIGPLDAGVGIDRLRDAGIPVPSNYSAPAYTGLHEDIDVHLQAIRIGPLLLPICSCEQWWDQSRNIELRTDRVEGNETLPGNLGYDWGAQCTPNGDGNYPPNDDGIPQNDEGGVGQQTGTGTWSCPNSTPPVTHHEYLRMRAQVNNPANGWNDPENAASAESEPPAPEEIKGNYTHDDDATSAELGYDLTVPIGMANDYNGYIASYREYQRGDHYRKALTGWGPHSSDYMASRLVTMGRQFNDPDYDRPTDQELEDLLQPKVSADLTVNDQRALALGTVGGAALAAFEAGLPDDGGDAAAISQPEDIERFDAAFFSWTGGSNYTDDPVVKVQRRAESGEWEDYADQSGEIPVTLEFPSVQDGVAPYLRGEQEWRWTARFEAFVAGAEDRPIDTGDRAAATPAGSYRFVVEGQRREGGQAVGYEFASEEFEVRPWDGILIQDFKLEPDGKMSFRVGPTSAFDAPVAGCSEDTVGPIDYPDTHPDPARFIHHQRTAIGDGSCDVEWFCFTCTWRPWLDFGDAETAQVAVILGNGTTELVEALRQDNRWRTERALRENETAQVRNGDVLDPYGNTNQDSIVLANGTAPADADGDGVLDTDDGCPAVPGPPSNGGCPEPDPVLDGDGDGVPDDADLCPGAPGPIDSFGCPEPGGASAPQGGPGAQGPQSGPARQVGPKRGKAKRCPKGRKRGKGKRRGGAKGKRRGSAKGKPRGGAKGKRRGKCAKKKKGRGRRRST